MEFEQNDRKQLKLASTIRRELDDIVRKDISDPRIGFITFTSVKVTGDLGKVIVHVSPLGDKKQQEESLNGLKSAAGYIRRVLAGRLRVRRTPELEFVRDDSQADRVEKLLKEIDGEGQPG